MDVIGGCFMIRVDWLGLCIFVGFTVSLLMYLWSAGWGFAFMSVFSLESFFWNLLIRDNIFKVKS